MTKDQKETCWLIIQSVQESLEEYTCLEEEVEDDVKEEMKAFILTQLQLVFN
jgi:hypothetical protein